MIIGLAVTPFPKVYFSISKEKGKCSPSPLDSFPLLMKLAPAASLIP
ncbi:hypothetical protein OMAG_002861 [Candidatus Omnitrophus magneticus]|uniref:Uncharacterized protein n=1 Tax=Candidatus Omnitrophus magneticus TaxID=1609969 RepID=A0A0F0CJ86_9BACT|nr:hypothetical protein OMAG_002861 [Candidatus Omnitrophus magneticus]